jgi:hypothetical protein
MPRARGDIPTSLAGPRPLRTLDRATRWIVRGFRGRASTSTGDEDPTDYPDPICSKCTIIVLDGEGAEAFLEQLGMTYLPEDPDYEGDLEVTLMEDDEDPDRVWIIDVRPAGITPR